MDRTHTLTRLIQKFKVHRIVALLGPRQCGKTTLAKSYCQTEDGFVRRNYFDLENPNDLARLNDPYNTLNDLNGLIVIDEVQRAPELFPILRVLHDDDPAKRFLVLGSASKHLLHQSSESLTGRIHYEEITPFCYTEVREWKNLLFRGGFPRSYLAETDEESLQWREDYVRTLLEQDVPNLGFRIPATHLRRFWMMLANCHGQIFNAHEIGQSLDLSAPAMRRYLDLLNDMLMVRILQPWHANIGKRQVKSPKSYIRDSGIFHYLTHLNDRDALALSPKRGASFEGFVLEEIIRTTHAKPEDCFFWRTHAGAELDLLLLIGDKKIGFEIKMTDKPAMTKSMQAALNDCELDHLYLVHPGDVSWPLGDKMTALCLSDISEINHKLKALQKSG